MSERVSKYVELVYRVFARQLEDTSPRFDEIVQRLHSSTALLTHERVDRIGEVENYYLPCSPEDVEKARERGLLLTEFDGKLCYVIRQQTLRIRSETAGSMLELLREDFRGQFAVMRMVEDVLTEVVAV
jgi:hypothetical protein